jgi:hypothetical protein
MKKLFAVLALVGVMTSCKDKKSDDKKPEDKMTNTPATTTPTEPTANTTAPAGVPTFSDPEVQKFANDYAGFVMTYKTGITDPSKAQELAKSAQEWSTRSQAIVTKLMQNPQEAQKLATFLAACVKEMMPAAKMPAMK